MTFVPALTLIPCFLKERARAWEILRGVEQNPGRYPEPVRWLPELARWACRRTGNPLLDRPSAAHWVEPYHDGLWLSWESEPEVEQTRSAWRRARLTRSNWLSR